MRDSFALGTGVCLSVYARRTNRYRFSKFFNRRRSSWHILRGGTLSLCIINGSCVRYICWFFSLVSSVLRMQTSPPVKKGSLFHNVRRSKPDFFPPTLFRSSWNATALFRLSGRLYSMKNRFFNRVYNLISGNAYILVFDLRSFRFATGVYCSWVLTRILRVTIFVFPAFTPHIWWDPFNCYNYKVKI